MRQEIDGPKILRLAKGGGGAGNIFWAEIQTTPTGTETTLSCKRSDGGYSSSGDDITVDVDAFTSDGSQAYLVDCIPIFKGVEDAEPGYCTWILVKPYVKQDQSAGYKMIYPTAFKCGLGE